ncbi:MAG: fibrobacter succinogenes major paralogous domain-containing protein [Candidatus Kapabacteria bacterium]|nr:fibrobacter succinogenes major paralogous domain-containing protein [Candidatus Kapabacteria bacterium]
MKKIFFLSSISIIIFILSCNNYQYNLDLTTKDKIYPPLITRIDPDTAIVGDYIYIWGQHLCYDNRVMYVSFNGVKVGMIDSCYCNSDAVFAKVPVGATSGKINVKTEKGDISNDMEFVIIPPYKKIFGTVQDIENNSYKTVKIGNQIWMAENLNVSHYRNGDTIPFVQIHAQWLDLITCAILGTSFGKLYNWFTVNDPRGLAPIGWHIASDSDWKVLGWFLGGDGYAGGKLKEVGTDHWRSPNYKASNQFGFTALAGGMCNSKNEIHNFDKQEGYWWTSTEIDSQLVWSKVIYDNNCALISFRNIKTDGFAVRCVKD